MERVEPDVGFTFYDGMNSEYQAAVAALSLELPAGEKLPENAPGNATDENVIWQHGSGEVAALFSWLVIVEQAAARAHRAGDMREARRWLMVAAQFVETDTFRDYNDPDVPISWYDAVIVPALAGDYSALIAEADAAARSIVDPAPAGLERKK